MASRIDMSTSFGRLLTGLPRILGVAEPMQSPDAGMDAVARSHASVAALTVLTTRARPESGGARMGWRLGPGAAPS